MAAPPTPTAATGDEPSHSGKRPSLFAAPCSWCGRFALAPELGQPQSEKATTGPLHRDLARTPWGVIAAMRNARGRPGGPPRPWIDPATGAACCAWPDCPGMKQPTVAAPAIQGSKPTDDALALAAMFLGRSPACRDCGRRIPVPYNCTAVVPLSCWDAAPSAARTGGDERSSSTVVEFACSFLPRIFPGRDAVIANCRRRERQPAVDQGGSCCALDGPRRVPYAAALKVDRTSERAYHAGVRLRVKSGPGEWVALTAFATAATATPASPKQAKAVAVPAVYTTRHGLLLQDGEATVSPKRPRPTAGGKQSSSTASLTTGGNSKVSAAQDGVAAVRCATPAGKSKAKTSGAPSEVAAAKPTSKRLKAKAEPASSSTATKKAAKAEKRDEAAVVFVSSSSSSSSSTSSASAAGSSSDDDDDDTAVVDAVVAAPSSSSSGETEEEEAEFWALCNLCGTWRTVPEPVDAARTLVCSDLRRPPPPPAPATSGIGRSAAIGLSPSYVCDGARLRTMMRWVRRAQSRRHDSAFTPTPAKAAKRKPQAGKRSGGAKIAEGRRRASSEDDKAAAAASGPEDDEQLAGYHDAAAGRPAQDGVVRRADDGTRTGFTGAEALFDEDAWSRALELAGVTPRKRR